MKAIILAAGRGSRMGELTADRPKCLVEYRGKPLLDWQLEALHGAGITEIGVVRGYLGYMLENRGLTLFDNPRWAETNMVASLLCAQCWLQADICIVSYSDIVYPTSAVSSLIETDADIAITYDINWRRLWRRRFANVLADAEAFKIDGEGWILEIGGRAAQEKEIQGQYMGLLKFTPPGWQAMKNVLENLRQKDQNNLSMTELLQVSINRGLMVKGCGLEVNWLEVDSYTDLTIEI